MDQRLLLLRNSRRQYIQRSPSQILRIQKVWTQFLGTPKLITILTDNKSVTRLFQTQIIPPPLWNACDYVIQFNFIIAHIQGKNNTAADYLPCMEMDPNEKLILKIREGVETRPIEVNVQSAGVSEEEQVFFTEEGDETEEQIWEHKRLSKEGHKVDETVIQIHAITEINVMKSKLSPENYDDPIRYWWSRPKVQYCFNSKRKNGMKNILKKFSNRTYGTCTTWKTQTA